MNKKAGMMIKYIASILMFSLVIVGFHVIPNQRPAGFWEAYKYTPPEDLTGFDKSSQIDNTITNIACDINQEDSCDTEQKNKFQQAGNFIGSMVQGGYGGLITLYKSFSISKTLVLDAGSTITVPPEITAIFATLVLAVIAITILLIIFNRSDTI